jgi:hypothetical protein
VVTATSDVARTATRKVTVVYRQTEAEIAEQTRQAEEQYRQQQEAERLRREQQRQQRIAENTFSFSGNGTKNIGTVRVREESILEWTNNDDPALRFIVIYDEDFGLTVSSEASSGDSVVPPGTYRNIEVSGGSWTVTIRPR